MSSAALSITNHTMHLRARWLYFALGAVVLHLLAWQFFNHGVSLPALKPVSQKTVEVRLQTPAAKALPANPSPSVVRHKKPASATPIVVTNHRAAAFDSGMAAPMVIATEAAEAMPAGTELAAAPPQPAAVPAKPVPAPAPAPAVQAASKDPSTAQYKVLPPRSAKLSLTLLRTEPNRNPYYGVGEIDWQVADGKYSMRTLAGLDLLLTTVNLYKLVSEGTIDDNGIAPRISSETRRGRSETATHFNREQNNISFSASSKSVELSAGAQDKNTILMQLAGIGNADPAQMQQGREFAIQIAEERDATVFQFVVDGQEQLETKLGTLATWHLVRPPRPGSYNSRLDIWLAPELQWYPVQIRNTESNGAITTQTVTQITQPHP